MTARARYWTEREIEILVWQTLEGAMLRDIAAQIKRSPRACSLMRVKLGVGDMRNCSRGWFVEGQVPHNKGLRRPGWSAGRMRETQFRKGERHGVAAENYCPLGTIKADGEGYLRIKVRDALAGEYTGFGNVKVWPLMQRHVWEKERGPIPTGHNVVFKDGDRANCALENLELVSRADMMRRNTIHRLPEELRNTIMLLGAVKRKVREKSGKKQND